MASTKQNSIFIQLSLIWFLKREVCLFPKKIVKKEKKRNVTI